MRPRFLLLSCLLSLASSLVVVGPAVASDAPETSTAFSVVTEPADPTVEAGSTFYAADDQVRTYSRSPRTLILDQNVSSSGAEVLSLTGPTSRPFAAGVTYPVGRRADATHAAISLYPLGCGTVTAGTLTFDAVTFAAGIVATADGSYAVQCASGRAHGVFHLRSTTPWNGVVGRGFDHSVNSGPLGRTDTVTASFEAVGTTPSPARTAVVGGSGSAEATVVTDTCTGTPLAVGATCGVTLSVHRAEVGPHDLVVTLGDDARSAITYTTYDPPSGTFYTPPTPRRVLDTRTAVGYLGGPVVAGTPRYLNLEQDVLPIAASAVVVNVTAVDPTTAGFLTLGEYGRSTSSLNFAAGQTVANLVTVPTQYNRLLIGTSTGSVDVVVDLVGWYAADYVSPSTSAGRGGGWHPTVPARALDTRTWGHGQLLPGERAIVPVHVATDDAHVHAVAVTVTTTDATAPGYVTAYDATSATPPDTSTLNLATGATVSNAAVVPVSACGQTCPTDHAVAVVNRSTAPVDVLVDVTGWYDDGGVPADIRLRPRLLPVRIADTRTRLGLFRLRTNSSQVLTPAADLTDVDTVGLSTNVTTLGATAPTYLTVWPAGTPRPTVSLVDPAPGGVVASHADVAVGPSGGLGVYNQAGQLDVVVDLVGTFERFPATPTDQQNSPPPAVVLGRVVAGPVAPFPAR